MFNLISQFVSQIQRCGSSRIFGSINFNLFLISELNVLLLDKLTTAHKCSQMDFYKVSRFNGKETVMNTSFRNRRTGRFCVRRSLSRCSNNQRSSVNVSRILPHHPSSSMIRSR